jgi:hypothetical protein
MFLLTGSAANAVCLYVVTSESLAGNYTHSPQACLMSVAPEIV